MLEKNNFSTKHEQYATQKLVVQHQHEGTKIMLTSLDSILDPTDHEYFQMRKAEIMEIRTRESQLQQSSGIFGYGSFSNVNQFHTGSQVTFNSSNSGSPVQFPNGFGGSRGYR